MGVPMDIRSKKPQLVAIAANGVLVAIEAWAIGTRLLEVGMGTFVFYTQCSNALAMIAGACTLVQLVRGIRITPGVRRLKFVSCCTQMITFLVVLIVLTPMLNHAGQDGWRQMFWDSCRMVTHLLGPVLTVASWLLTDGLAASCEDDPVPSRSDVRISLVPTLAYGLVAYTCNFLRLWDGPYPFLRVWNQPIWLSVLWFVVLLASAWGIACALRAAARAVTDKTPRRIRVTGSHKR